MLIASFLLTLAIGPRAIAETEFQLLPIKRLPPSYGSPREPTEILRPSDEDWTQNGRLLELEGAD